MTVQKLLIFFLSKNMDSKSERQVKIDHVGKANEVLHLKGDKIAQLAQKISFQNLYFW